MYYNAKRIMSEDEFSDINKRVCASVLARFWEEETLIWGSEEEERNVEDVSQWLVDLAPLLCEELKDSYTNFVNEGEEVWR